MSWSCTSGRCVGFTLIELLVSMVIVALLVVMLISMTNSVGRIWTQTTAKAEQFRDAREAFDSVTRKLSQVTLNPYLDYVDSSGNFRNSANASGFVPNTYKRRAELRFISGDAPTLAGESTYSTGGTNSVSIAPPHAIFFQAPLGRVTDSQYSDLGNVLNTAGYFIEYGDDSQLRPAFLAGMNPAPPLRFRFRLMEMEESSDNLTVYKWTSGTPTYIGTDWFSVPFKQTSTSTPPRPVSVLAENIVALILLPQLSPSDQTAAGHAPYTAASLAPTYLYDSTGTNMTTVNDAYLNPTNQLPPVVQVTMVAVDETSFSRAYPSGTATMPTYTSGLFADATKYSADLNQLQANLLGKNYVVGTTTYAPANPGQLPLNYRIFTTNVSVKAAKWSQLQTH